jgi:hypothetical protein
LSSPFLKKVFGFVFAGVFARFECHFEKQTRTKRERAFRGCFEPHFEGWNPPLNLPNFSRSEPKRTNREQTFSKPVLSPGISQTSPESHKKRGISPLFI